MISKYIQRAAVTVIVLLLSFTALTALFSGGRGLDYDPFIVSNVDDLVLIRDYPEAYFRQSGDISLDVDPHNGRDGWVPIGDYDNPFSGSYDGDNYRITGLYINREEERDLGLFGYIYDADIKNVRLIDVDVYGYYNIGGLVGYAYFSRIETCFVSGKIEGTSFYVGAISGLIMYSDITLCTGSGEVIGSTEVGGLIGASNESIIQDSGSNADVEGSFSVGGLVGNSYTLGGCGRSNTGGLAGLRNGTYIKSSYATGTVFGSHSVGGLVGKNENAFIYNSYATGNVEGENTVGGLAGELIDSQLENSYSTGTVTGERNVGGFIGSILGSVVINSYWDTESSETDNSSAGLGRTTAQMTPPYDENTYVDWDFEDIWSEDSEDEINNGYPILIWQIPVINPYPNPAVDPYPNDNSENVSVDMDELFWSFTAEEGYSVPEAFRIYINTTGEFAEEDDYYRTVYMPDSTRYAVSIADIIPLEYNTTYYWRVVPTSDEDDNNADAETVPVWSFTTIDPTEVGGINESPLLTGLHSNYPNPFNPQTTIRFTIAEDAFVTLDIYNSIGQKVLTLVNENLPSGSHQVVWHGQDSRGKQLSSGVYLYRMKKGSYSASGKMIMMK